MFHSSYVRETLLKQILIIGSAESRFGREIKQVLLCQQEAKELLYNLCAHYLPTLSLLQAGFASFSGGHASPVSRLDYIGNKGFTMHPSTDALFV